MNVLTQEQIQILGLVPLLANLSIMETQRAQRATKAIKEIERSQAQAMMTHRAPALIATINLILGAREGPTSFEMASSRINCTCLRNDITQFSLFSRSPSSSSSDEEKKHKKRHKKEKKSKVCIQVEFWYDSAVL
jgi:hypothetical protein